MMTTKIRTSAVALVCGALLLRAGDWPTYRGNPRRDGVSTEALTFPLHARWSWRSVQAPSPAWPQPGKELHRIDFDYAFQPVIADGKVLFASSADHTLRCVALADGKTRWQFVSNGPLRFAPDVADGKAYIAGDDGFVRCLNLERGEIIWSFRCAPAENLILGNGRIISRWPARTGVLVQDNTVYVTAGMWPAQGIHVYALKADTGSVIWHNDSSGSVYMRFPHPVASGFGGVAPQGYLLSSGNRLLVPTGRNIPAVFDRTTGELLHYKAAEALQDGGTRCTVWRNVIFTPTNRFAGVSEAHVGEAPPASADGMAVYSLKTGEKLLRLGGKYRVLPAGDRLFTIGNGKIECLDISQWQPSRGKLPDKVVWSQLCSLPAYSVILAGKALLIGSDGAVQAYDAATGETLWQAEVDGQARGLAVADSCLVVSTDRGTVTCFALGPPSPSPAASKAPALASGTTPGADKARDILATTGVRQGYALVLGETTTGLALDLARQSELHVIAIALPETDLQACRTELLHTGLYGTRLVLLGNPAIERLSLPPYCADLIVVGAGTPRLPASQICRVLRPCGGQLVCPDMAPQDLTTFAQSAGFPELSVTPDGEVIVRGKLPGAGDWPHPWADAGRSSIGKEQRLQLPFDVLWFGGPGPDRMMDRHLATSPPLSVSGRVFVTGENHIIAFDAYTGRELWAKPLKGAGRSYSRYYAANVVADDDSLYVATQGHCTRLDQVTGNVETVYEIPAHLMGEPDDAVIRQLAEELSWAFSDRRHRVFLTCSPTPFARFPCVVQAGIDIADLLGSTGAQEQVIPPSARVTLGQDKVPAEAAMGANGVLHIRASLTTAPAPGQRLCVYFATEGRFTPPAAPARASPTAMLDGLIAAYDFETEGDAVVDVSGNEHGGAAKGVARVPGHTGRGVSFDGRKARVLVKPKKSLNPTWGLTAQAWVKLDRADTGTILYKAYQYALFVVKTEAGVCFSSTTRAGEFVNVTSPSPVEFGTWTHVAMTHDGTMQCLYVNGELVAEGQQGELTTSGNYLCLGASCYSPPKVYNHLACAIDDVRIYSRPLSPTEIQQNMEQAIPAVAVFRPTWVQRQGSSPRPIRDWGTRGWGYLSVANGTILGSYTAPVRDPQSAWAPRAESAALFALAKTDGKSRWTYRPKQSISNNEIVHSDGTVFLVDATSNSTVSLARRRGEEADTASQELVALRLTDGAEVWRQSDVPTPGHRTHTPEDGPVFLFIRHRSQLQVARGVVVVDGIAGYEAGTGQKLWQRSARFNKLAAIHGEMLIAPPYAYDLRTGQRCTDTDAVTGREGAWRFIKAYGCGATIGCQDLLMFRSGSFGFLDLKTRGTTTFAGGKPSCNVSMIPANGLVIAAEGSSGCACSYNFQTSLALIPAEREQDVWFAFPAVASRGDVRSLRLNLGAPGDRRAADGNVWLGFPRPQLGGVSPVAVSAQLTDAEYVYHPQQRRGTPHWLYHCGLRGSGTISIDLVLGSTLAVQRAKTPPVIDGNDTDTCWQETKATSFLDTGRVALAPTVELKLLRDDTNLYAICRRRGSPPQPGNADANDAFQLFVTDAKRKQAARFGVTADGNAFEEGGKRPRRKNLDASWQGTWQHSVIANANGWVAEFAIPLPTLAKLGLQQDKLALNAMARLQTRQGQREIYLVDPIFRFAHCIRFLPLAEMSAPGEERSFRVRLHFATAPDFGIRVQGQDVPELATASSSAGRGRAVIRELRGVHARDTLTIDLIPTRPDVIPVINAIEILEETSPQP